jgi:hypothetical protein
METREIDFTAAVEEFEKIEGGTAIKKQGNLPAVTMDIDAAKAMIAPYTESIDMMVKEAEAIDVRDEATNAAAVTLGTSAKMLSKKIKELVKRLTEDAAEYVDSIKAFGKMFTIKLDGIEKGTKGKISTYQYRLELKRREEEAAAKKRAEKLQADLDKEAKEKGLEPVKVTAPVMPKPSSVTRTETGSSSLRMDWTFEVKDEAEVPREYLMVDTKKIQKAVDAGIRNIAGVDIFEKPITAFKTNA